jgi:aldehyde dehydrogenase (NAD+)
MTVATSTVTRLDAQRLVPKATSFVAGSLAEGTGASTPLVYAATGEKYGQLTLAGPSEVDAAVAAAREAASQWGVFAPGARRDLLFAMAVAIRHNADDLASLVSLEMGMPRRASEAGIHAAADWFAHYAGWADKNYGLNVPVASESVHDYVTYTPRGVVAAIIPWNGPIIAAALKVAPALAAGNCVVLKPSELAPLSSVHLACVLAQAGLPSGVLSVVGGGPDVGAHLIQSPDIDMISFTGGNAAGRSVGQVAAERRLPVVLELGGKSASLVFAGCNPERAGKLAVLLGAVQNSGQGCFLPTRLLVERSIYDDVVAAAAATAATTRIGDPFQPHVSMGPVVNSAAAERILDLIARTEKAGDGRLVAGGRHAGGELGAGSFVEPTVFADVDPLSPLGQEEVFGPVLAVTSFEDEDEAVALANGTAFGLAGYVWTPDLARAHRVANRLDAGYVSVNGMAGLPPAAPFGGWKSSGLGVEGGLAGLREYQRTKNVHVAL